MILQPDQPGERPFSRRARSLRARLLLYLSMSRQHMLRIGLVYGTQAFNPNIFQRPPSQCQRCSLLVSGGSRVDRKDSLAVRRARP